MVIEGFCDELRTLMARPGLERESASMRAVGYRQYWAYLAGECSEEEAFRRALYATRQLAKRQITWLRKDSLTEEKAAFTVDPLEEGSIESIYEYLADEVG